MESLGFFFDVETMTEGEMILSKYTIVNNEIPLEDLINIWNMDNDDAIEDLKKLGSGSMGDVYEYKSLNGNSYAVKVIDSFERNMGSRSKDARNLHRLQGVSCIPKLYAYIPNKLIVMEKIEGKNVRKLLNEDYEYMSDDFYNVFVDSLMEIKDKGFFPHDLHEDNVMMNKDGLPVIVDVGHFKISENDYKSHNWRLDDYLNRYKTVFDTRNRYLNKKEKLAIV